MPFANLRHSNALLAYFGMVGLLNEQRLKDIQALEALLDKEGEFQKITLRFSRILKAQVAVEEPSTSPVADREFPN